MALVRATPQFLVGTAGVPELGIEFNGVKASLVTSQSLMTSLLPVRRAMYPTNLIDPAGTTSLLQTLGTATVAGTHPNPRTYDLVATATGSTARITAGPNTITLDTTKIYELSAKVVAYSVANQGAMASRWMEASSGVSAGVSNLNFGSTIPVVGTRYAIRFTPTNASNIFRFGFGCNAGENVTSGDRIKFEDIQLVEVDSLSGTVTPFSYAPYGAAGKAASATDQIGSCIIVCGDSWANDATDFARLLGTTYRRELILSATAGHRLDQIATDLSAKIASGQTGLNRPYFHTPGVAVIQGGINDAVAGASAWTMYSRLRSMIDGVLTPRGIVPVVVLPVLPTNSSSYTAARLAAVNGYCPMVFESGLRVVTTADWCLNADGSANTTYMADDTGVWIHPTTYGHSILAGKVDAAIRVIEQSRNMILPSATW